MYYLGIDGGGTKTTAVVADKDGITVTEVSGGSINYRSVGLDVARINMSAMLDDIKAQTGITHFRSVFVGMSALSGKATQNELDAFCGGIFDADKINMDSDLYIALAACDTSRPLAAICGTGSMAAAVKEGKVITKGGFGYILGDEGSGFAIASDGLKAAVRAGEDITEKTVLTDYALEYFGVGDIYKLINVCYEPPLSRSRLASFAPFVTKAAEEGDSIAFDIIKKQVHEFALTVKALVRELDYKPDIRLYGGVFEHSKLFTEMFTDEIKNSCTGIGLMKKRPVDGAVKCAIEKDK